LLVSDYGLTSLTLVGCCEDIATPESIDWFLSQISAIACCNCGIWSLSLPLAQAVSDMWGFGDALRVECTEKLLEIMTRDLRASTDTAYLAVAEQLPLLYIQLSNASEDPAIQDKMRSAAVQALAHPMIFKSVVAPVQR
jgi:hypothetical protein